MRILYCYAACVAVCLSHMAAWSANRYWVGSSVYINSFSISADLSQWSLTEDNGTGSWALSANGSAILKMDNAGGGYANRLFNVNGGSPNLLPLDKVNGIVEFQVIALTGGNQRFFLQVQEFNSAGVYINQQTILAPSNAAGYYSVSLSGVSWNAATTQIRFIIGGENYSATQGTIEFNYFNYSNTVKSWGNAANWSATSGGASGASVPGAADVAIFDGAAGTNGLCFLTGAVTVGGITMSGYRGSVDLRGFNLTTTGTSNFVTGDFANTGGAASLILNTTGTTTFAGTSFYVVVAGSTANLLFNGSYFLNAVNLTKTGGSTNLSTGNNVFRGPVTLTNNAATTLRMANLYRDIFNSTLSVTVGNAAAVVDFSYIATGNQFNDNVTLTYTAAGAITFGGGGGTSVLATGKTAAVSTCTGACGSLSLAGVETNTAQNITFPSGGSFRTLLASIWNGDLTVSAATVRLDGATFNGTTSITKTGSSDDYSDGGNAFNGPTSIINSGSGIMRLAGNTGDAFNGNVSFARFSGTLEPAYNGLNTFVGNITTNSSSSITFGVGVGIVSFSGTNPQALSRAGGTAAPVIRRIEINKTSNQLTLNTPVTISTSLTLASGVIVSTAANYVAIDDGASVTGAKNASHVSGVVRKAGVTDFTFPIGDGALYRPLTIQGITLASVFSAQYYKTPQTFGSNKLFTLYAVSACEYWDLTRESGLGIPFVTLYWQSLACNASSYVTDPADMRVSHWTGLFWDDLGAGLITGNAAAGSVRTVLPVLSFSPFTLASATPDNPLPVSLDKFKGIADGNESVLFWETATEHNNASFTITRSANGKDFETIGTIPGNGTTKDRSYYTFRDNNPGSGVNYYRLVQTDYDERAHPSTIIAVDMQGTYNENEFSVYPNPSDRGWVSFNRPVSFRVVNAMGQVILPGQHAGGFDAGPLPAGLYWVITGSGKAAKLIIR